MKVQLYIHKRGFGVPTPKASGLMIGTLPAPEGITIDKLNKLMDAGRVVAEVVDEVEVDKTEAAAPVSKPHRKREVNKK